MDYKRIINPATLYFFTLNEKSFFERNYCSFKNNGWLGTSPMSIKKLK